MQTPPSPTSQSPTLPERPILVLATRNAGKIRELQSMLEGQDVEVIDLTELEKRLGLPDKSLGDVDERGVTYAENADIKAQDIANAIRTSGLADKERYVVIADDSGLELLGATWIAGDDIKRGQSDRLAGLPLPGVDTKQLEESMGPDPKSRIAPMCAFLNARVGGQFGYLEAITVLAVQLVSAAANTPSLYFEGRVGGTLAKNPRGENGFGYDPYFIPDGQKTEKHLTFAEMEPATKNRISHRNQAFEKALAALSGRGTLDRRTTREVMPKP